MQQNAPVESGIGSFAKAFGDTVAKGSANEQKAAFKKWVDDNNAKNKKTLAEDQNKVKAQNNSKGPQGTGKGDPQLMNARKALAAVNKIETHLKTFGDTIANPMNTNNNPAVMKHYELYLKDAVQKGMPTADAINFAKQKIFADSYPDEAKVLYNAHAGGTVAHILQNYPQLGQEFPTVALKYQSTPQPKSPIDSNAPVKAPAAPMAIQTQRQPVAQPTQAPQQTSQAPMAQPKAPIQPPIQMAKAPSQPMKMPDVGGNPVGPQSPPNTMIPGQGPASGQDEEALDNTPEV